MAFGNQRRHHKHVLNGPAQNNFCCSLLFFISTHDGLSTQNRKYTGEAKAGYHSKLIVYSNIKILKRVFKIYECRLSGRRGVRGTSGGIHEVNLKSSYLSFLFSPFETYFRSIAPARTLYCRPGFHSPPL